MRSHIFTSFLLIHIVDSTFHHLSREGNVSHASVNQLLHACLLTKWKKRNILSLFLQIHIVESTIPRRSSVPLSLQKGAAYGMLPICKAFVCLPFYKRSFHIPLQSPWGGTRPLSVSSSSILSFIQTYSILLSTIRQQKPSRDEWMLPDSKMAPELYKVVRPRAIFGFGIS